METFTTIIVGLARLAVIGALLFPFITGMLFGTANDYYETKFGRFYFKIYPLVTIALAALVLLGIFVYKLGSL